MVQRSPAKCCRPIAGHAPRCDLEHMKRVFMVRVIVFCDAAAVIYLQSRQGEKTPPKLVTAIF